MNIQNPQFHFSTTLSRPAVESEQPLRQQSNPSEDQTTPRVGAETPVGRHSVNVIEGLTQKLVADTHRNDRVAEIRERLAAGTFEIDAEKVADRLLWGERIEQLAR